MIQINLLPWREQARQVRQIQFAMTSGIYLAFALLFILLMHFYMNALIHYQVKRNQFLQEQLTRAKNEIISLDKQKVQIKQVEAKLKFIMDLRAKSFRAVHLLNELATSVPTNISLLRISRQNDFVSLDGKAKSDLDITQLMKQLATIPGFTQPILTGISTKKDISETDRYFQLKVNQL